MRTLETLKPGQMGTRELLARYGPSLLCVRYRYDEDTRERLKTVESVVHLRPGPLRRRHPRAPEDGRVGHPSALARARSKVPWIAEARRSSWKRCETEGCSADRLGETDLRRWVTSPPEVGGTRPGGSGCCRAKLSRVRIY